MGDLMRRHELTDFEWRIIEPQLSNKGVVAEGCHAPSDGLNPIFQTPTRAMAVLTEPARCRYLIFFFVTSQSE
jgi:transposase